MLSIAFSFFKKCGVGYFGKYISVEHLFGVLCFASRSRLIHSLRALESVGLFVAIVSGRVE